MGRTAASGRSLVNGGGQRAPVARLTRAVARGRGGSATQGAAWRPPLLTSSRRRAGHGVASSPPAGGEQRVLRQGRASGGTRRRAVTEAPSVSGAAARLEQTQKRLRRLPPAGRDVASILKRLAVRCKPSYLAECRGLIAFLEVHALNFGTGASSDKLKMRRRLEDIKRRERWTTDATVKKYEKQTRA